MKNQDHELLKYYIPVIIKHLEPSVKDVRKKKLEKIKTKLWQ